MAFSVKGTYTVTSDMAKLPSSQTDYPVLVYISDPKIKHTSFGGYVTSLSGHDIVLKLASDLTGSAMSYELVSYDGTNGIAEFWVKKATLALGDLFYAGIGDVAITISQSAGSPWKTSYTMVQHLDEATNAPAVDSTSNANNSSAASATRTTGKIGNGQTFVAASTNAITIPGIAALNGSTKSVLSCWFKRTSAGAAVYFGADVDDAHRHIIQVYTDGIIYISFTQTGAYAHFSHNDTAWHLIHVVHDGTQGSSPTILKVYLDGVQQSLTFVGGAPNVLDTTGSTFYIGKDRTNYSDGSIDEGRLIVGDILSDDWIITDSYQYPDSGFLTQSYEVLPQGLVLSPIVSGRVY